MAGRDSISAERRAACALAGALAALLVGSTGTTADTLYKYRGPNGEWIYTDRQPESGTEVEVRELARGDADPEVIVSHEQREDGGLELTAGNGYFAPVELVLGIDALENALPLPPDQPLRFVLPARGERVPLFPVEPGAAGVQAAIRYRYTWVMGDPLAEHRPDRPYRVPYAVAAGYTVSQAFPEAVTHTTPDSRYAVDITMPVGTDVHAARGGVVIEVASTNFRGGADPENAAEANLVRILHDDGTFAVYAHLNRSTIRVKPGDVVQRGEYIADSGNTGFTTGPHLHFAVQRNRGMGVESLPIVFEGPRGTQVTPRTGVELVAW
jgi:murein DD-endopeptidase MepM/ murein hydrolase activator NlpD